MYTCICRVKVEIWCLLSVCGKFVSKKLIEFTEKLVQSYIHVVSSSFPPCHWQQAAITSHFLVFACNIHVHVPQEANRYQCSPLTEHATVVGL